MGANRSAESLKLWVVLSRAHAAVAERVRADIARHGLSEAEFGALEVLHHKGPLLLGEVKRLILVSSGGITYVIDRLVAKGLVERRECPTDRRAAYAALTPAGEELIAGIFPEHARVIEEAVSALDGSDRKRAIKLLRKLGRGVPAEAAAAES